MVARRERDAGDGEVDGAGIGETGGRTEPQSRELLGDKLLVLESTVHDAAQSSGSLRLSTTVAALIPRRPG